jgi:hypothetical protein
MVGILTAMAAEEVVGNLVEAVSSTYKPEINYYVLCLMSYNTKYELRKKHVCCDKVAGVPTTEAVFKLISYPFDKAA